MLFRFLANQNFWGCTFTTCTPTSNTTAFLKNFIRNFMVHQDWLETNLLQIFGHPRKFRMIFYKFCYYFWGQHCWWTETNIFGNDFFVLYIFPLPSTVSLLPCPTAAPAVSPVCNWKFQNRVYIIFLITTRNKCPLISYLPVHKPLAFCTTYICEAAFSKLITIKSKSDPFWKILRMSFVLDCLLPIYEGMICGKIIKCIHAISCAW